MKNRPEVVVVHVIFKKKDEIKTLLLRQSKDSLKNNWQMVAGKLKKGETAINGALREIQEETGRIPIVLYSADFLESCYFPLKNDIIFIPVFVAFFDKKEPIHLSLKEHDKYEWMSIQDAIRRLEFSGQRKALEHIHNEFIKKEPNQRFLVWRRDE